MGNKKGSILKPLILMPESDNECWVWIGKISNSGYGHKNFDGNTFLAHRWVYSIFHGHIPDSLVIDHKCKNRRCVNPKHLHAVSQQVNCQLGSGTKLTVEQAKEIKKRITNLKWGERKLLALEYGVSEGLISDIKYGRAWSNI